MKTKALQGSSLKNKDEVFRELSAIMDELFEVPKSNISLESRFYEDLDLDSIDAVDLIGQLQVVLGERVNPDDFKSIRTVGDVVDVVASMIERRQSAS